MPTLTKQSLPAHFDVAGSDITLTAGDLGGDDWVAGDNDLLLVKNDDVAARTITVTSVADPTFSRTKDITARSVPAGAIAMFRFKRTGWAAAGTGKISLTVSNVLLKLAVIDLQTNP